MRLALHLLLPPAGDSRHLHQVVAVADRAGFESVLTPTGPREDDAWLTAAMLARETERLKLLVTLRPGLMSPTLAAQMAATLQWQSAGRLLLNVVTGGEPQEQLAYGDSLGEADRYARSAEFLGVVRQLWEGRESVTFHGEHLFVENASLQRRPAPVPPIYVDGSSPEAGALAVEHADTYLTRAERLPAVAEELDGIRRLAKLAGRSLSYGVRLHVIARHSSDEAWAAAHRRLPGSVLVGSHEEVAERISEYADLGVDHFILSGNPHPEEVWHFAEGVVPTLERRGLLTRRPSTSSCAGSTRS